MVIRPLNVRTYCAQSAFLIWDFGESCMIVDGITSQPANVFPNVPYLHFQCLEGTWGS